MKIDKKEWWVMTEAMDSLLYIFFYIFPLLMLLYGRKFRPDLTIFPIPIKAVDLLTPYLLISVGIQTNLAGLSPAHLYFYIFLSLFGIVYSSYLAFGKRVLLVGNFFRTWWRYVFIFSMIYHILVGGYGIYLNILQ